MKKIKSEEYEAEVDSWFAIHHRNTVEKKTFSHDVAGVDVFLQRQRKTTQHVFHTGSEWKERI